VKVSGLCAAFAQDVFVFLNVKVLFFVLCSALSTLTFLDLKNAGLALDDECFTVLSNRLGSRLRRLEVVMR
jgi:hypothetical protein